MKLKNYYSLVLNIVILVMLSLQDTIIVNEKIAEIWVTWDNMVAMQQLGLFPPPQDDNNSKNKMVF